MLEPCWNHAGTMLEDVFLFRKQTRCICHSLPCSTCRPVYVHTKQAYVYVVYVVNGLANEFLAVPPNAREEFPYVYMYTLIYTYVHSYMTI